MSWKSVSSCMFLTFRKSKILKYSEKVWVHGHSCSLYIPIRNIQGLTPSHFWHFLAPFVKKCMSLYVSGPLTTDQEHTRTGTFWWKGVSPCTFLANSYRLREYTRTHTFSLNIWWKGVSPCMFLPHTYCHTGDIHFLYISLQNSIKCGLENIDEFQCLICGKTYMWQEHTRTHTFSPNV